jgi:glyoxylase I family protein
MAIEIKNATTLLMVFDVPTSIALYRDVLGFEVISTSPPFSAAKDDYGWALLRLNGAELMLNNAYENNVRPAAPDAARIAAHADTVVYFTCPDLDAVHATLIAHGIAAESPTTAYYGMQQLYIKDPDGYGLCFQHPVAPMQ